MADHPCVPLDVDCGAHDLCDCIVLKRLSSCEEPLAAPDSERLPLDIDLTVVSFLLRPGHLKMIVLFQGIEGAIELLSEPEGRTVGAAHGT